MNAEAPQIQAETQVGERPAVDGGGNLPHQQECRMAGRQRTQRGKSVVRQSHPAPSDCRQAVEGPAHPSGRWYLVEW